MHEGLSLFLSVSISIAFATSVSRPSLVLGCTLLFFLFFFQKQPRKSLLIPTSAGKKKDCHAQTLCSAGVGLNVSDLGCIEYV